MAVESEKMQFSAFLLLGHTEDGKEKLDLLLEFRQYQVQKES